MNLKLLLTTMALACIATTPAHASGAFAAAPERAQHLSFESTTRGVGSDYGFALSVTTPYVGDGSFAFRFAWDNMQFSSGAGSVPGSFDHATYNVLNLDVLWATWLTERLRGFWQIGFGVIPTVGGVLSKASLAGDSAFGVEYFPASVEWVSFVARLGATEAAVLGGWDSGRSSLSRAPFGNGVMGEVGFGFYFY